VLLVFLDAAANRYEIPEPGEPGMNPDALLLITGPLLLRSGRVAAIIAWQKELIGV
jgi:hypothetical protein